MSNENQIAKFKEMVDLRELTVPVFELNNKFYVPARELIDYAGISWRSALKHIFDEESVILYGTTRLKVALYMPNRRTGTTDTQLETAKNIQISELICFELEKSYSYLLSISVKNMKAKGKVEEAKRLLELQKEWGKVIHDYETHGIAIKQQAFESTKHLKMLTDIYSKLNDTQQKYVVSKQIDACLGLNRNRPEQADMFADT